MLSSAWQVGIRLMIWHRLGDYRNGILNRRPLDELPEYLFAQRRNPEGRGYVLVWDNPYWVPDYDRRRLRWSSGGSSI
jgi:hypothetical protein